jgi:hypothetical protein
MVAWGWLDVPDVPKKDNGTESTVSATVHRDYPAAVPLGSIVSAEATLATGGDD